MSTILHVKLERLSWLTHWLSICVLLLLITPNVQGAADTPRPAVNGFLFSVEKENKKSYLLGTIHGGISEKQKLGENISAAIRGSTHVYVEADTRDAEVVTLAMSKAGIAKDGPGLRSLIGDTYFQFFARWFVNDLRILTAEQYQHARPWFIAMLVPVANARIEAAPTFEFGTEEQIFAIAKTNGVAIKELEGLNSQYSMFEHMTPEQESKYFLAFIERVQDRTLYRRQLALIEAWTNGDFASLEEVLKQSEKLTDEYSRFWSERGIHERNRRLSEKIARLSVNAGQQLFAIGSLHLPGADGVIAELKKAGFTVTELK